MPDASDLVTIALGEVDVRAVRLHPRPPSLLQGIPHFIVGVDWKLPLLAAEQDPVSVVVPGKSEQHLTVSADEVRLPVCRAEAVEHDDDVLVRSRPGKWEFDAPAPDPTGQLEYPLRLEVTIGSLRDLDGSPFDREPAPLTVDLSESPA
jgi:hypothetical protein